MAFTNFPGGVTSLGFPVLPGGLMIPPGGNAYFLNPGHPNASDANAGTDPNAPFLTFATAYAALTANQNDVLFYIGMDASITLTAAVTWAKDYTHLIGMCAPTHAAQRARIFQSASLTGASPLFTISASGCIFANFYIFQGVDDATSKINVSVTGSRNVFHNVHFAGGGHATQAIDGGASLHINGGSENLFERCTIGADTIAAATGMAGLVFAATGGAARNRFKNCHFSLYAGHAAAIFVELLGNSGLDRYQIFEDCLFTNLAATSMTQAVAVAAGFDPTNKRLLLKDCVLIGAGKWDNGDTGAVYGNMNAVTGADGSGGLVQLIT